MQIWYIHNVLYRHGLLILITTKLSAQYKEETTDPVNTTFKGRCQHMPQHRHSKHPFGDIHVHNSYSMALGIDGSKSTESEDISSRTRFIYVAISPYSDRAITIIYSI